MTFSQIGVRKSSARDKRFLNVIIPLTKDDFMKLIINIFHLNLVGDIF